MKAIAVFPGQKKVQLIDAPEPSLQGPHDVKLKMLDIGVCGTDKEICAFEYGNPPQGSDYLILGHESLGQVIEVGSGVKTLRPGDLVVNVVRRPCGDPHCVPCRVGRQDFCVTGGFKERGINGLHGFMTEKVVDDEKFMNLVPAELREVAVLAEPLTIAEKSLFQVWDIQARLPWACRHDQHPHRKGEKIPAAEIGYPHNAVVLGAGPVGLLGAMLLCSYGFKTFVYSREPAGSPKAQLTQEIGATYLSGSTVNLEQLAQIVGNVDLVYEATGASGFAFQMMKYLGTNGVFILTGVPGRKGPIEVDTDLIMRDLVLKNQVVFGSVNAGKNAYEKAIEDLGVFQKRWPNALKFLITGRYAPEKFQDLLLGAPGGIKNIVSFE
ncbi:MAG TPA: glucose 1-dehydrogenase [bacterium]|nr:glucose 1-dehydrogenase [bacterium]